MAGDRIVFHVDMDAFYASVEARDDPSLRGKPLVVGADPRGGAGRGVVCTASYEARVYGIKSAMPISQAWRLAPHAVYIRPDFRKYGPASQSVMEVLERYATVLEIVGLDEAYLDVTERCLDADGNPDWGAARSLARSLQAAVKRTTGLSCTVGVAPSKSVAKVASDYRKPHGVTCVEPSRVVSFLAPMGVGKLHGCGPKTASLLRDEGFTRVADLQASNAERDVGKLLGTHGAWLCAQARGEDHRPVVADHGARKSRGNETTFQRDESDTAEVLRAAADLLEEVLDHHDRRDKRPFSTLAVKVRYGDFTTLTRARTAAWPFVTQDAGTPARAWEIAKALLAPLLDGRAVRLVGVRLSGFADEDGQRTLSSFGAPLAGPVAERPLVALRPAKPRGAFDPGGLRWTSLGSWEPTLLASVAS